MKKIISSGVMLVAVLAVLVGGTGAFFSDTETSTGNVFTAGSIDLMVDHTRQTYNGVDCQTCGVTIYSSVNTEVVGSNGAASYSGPFPIDAQLLASPHPAWLNEATVAPAEWIWVTSVVDAGDTNNGAEYTFEDTFELQGPIALTDFNLSLASDNGYRLVVNGDVIVDRLEEENTYNALNPLTAPQQAAFQDALIQNGENSIQITVRNKAVAGSNTSSNPAGLIYKIEFTNEDCEAGVADFQLMCELWNAKDIETEKFFSFSDVKPQDHGTNLISLHVTSNEAYMCLSVANAENPENVANTSETTAGDNAVSTVGELGEYLTVAAWYSDVDGVKGDVLLPPTAINDIDQIPYADSTTVEDPVAPEVTQYVQLEWCLGEMTVTGEDEDTQVSCDGDVPEINQTQTDALIADLQFYAVQSRNNDEFTCVAPTVAP